MFLIDMVRQRRVGRSVGRQKQKKMQKKKAGQNAQRR